MSVLDKIKESIHSLSQEELSELQRYLLEVQAQARAPQDLEPIPVGVGREVLETKRHGSKCYRLEKIKCGKKNCKCARGELHGPYWHVYYRENGRLKCRYVGKTLPAMHPAVKQHSERVRKKAQEERDKAAKVVQESRDLRSQSRLLYSRHNDQSAGEVHGMVEPLKAGKAEP